MRSPTFLALSLTLFACLAGSAAHADHEDAFALREAGEILPFDRIVERALAVVPGTVLEAELERKRGRYVYELELLTPAGRHAKLYLDAKTGELVEAED